jgi:hypothetical protein
VVLALALPVTVFVAVVIVTIILSWANGKGMCDTWLNAALPYCS